MYAVVSHRGVGKFTTVAREPSTPHAVGRRACLSSVCHAVLAVKAFAREDARLRSAAEDRGRLDGCAAACRF